MTLDPRRQRQKQSFFRFWSYNKSIFFIT